jgi:hypothetical protein
VEYLLGIFFKSSQIKMQQPDWEMVVGQAFHNEIVFVDSLNQWMQNIHYFIIENRVVFIDSSSDIFSYVHAAEYRVGDLILFGLETRFCSVFYMITCCIQTGCSVMVTIFNKTEETSCLCMKFDKISLFWSFILQSYTVIFG